uniref:Uncharacterized protein n=1 Tax=Mola mola TaxID=94237 RepID=A0A3Q3WAY1_MOLML
MLFKNTQVTSVTFTAELGKRFCQVYPYNHNSTCCVSCVAPCSSIMLNCSRPDPPALVEALRPMFNLKSIRPVMNLSTPTNVTIHFVLFGILGVGWKNEFVGWDPQQCGSSWITIPRKLLWVPDVVINEFMQKNSAPFVPYSYLYHDGFVLDEQPVRLVSSCRLNMYTFPFDIQKCSLSFNSYLHRSTFFFFFFLNESTTLPEIYKMMFGSLFISLRRRATLYVVNLLIPSCFLITVDLFSFLLSPKDSGRSFFKMTLILGYTVFLFNMNDLLPVTGDTIPLTNVFLSLCLALMVASLLETILITNLCHSATYSPVPRWVRLVVLQTLGRLVWLHPKLRDLEDTVIQNPLPLLPPTSPLQQKQRSPLWVLKALHLQLTVRDGQNSEEWIQVGFIIDRLLFSLYVLFISVSIFTIIFIWVNSYNTT